MSELQLIAPLGGLVVIALFYMRRISDGTAAIAWGAAWLVLYLAGTLASLREVPPLLDAAGHVLGTLFPVLLCAGAISFRNGGPLPRGVLFVGLGIGLVRAALLLADRRSLALVIAIPLELPFMLGAAWFTWRAARGRRSFPEQLLPPTLILLAVVNAVDPIARLIGLHMVPLVLAWTSTCFATALLQIAAFVERGRDRERQLLLERNLLYRIARAGTEGSGRGPVLDAVARAISEAQWFDAFGVWLVSADGRRFERAARLRSNEPPNARFDAFPIDSPELLPVLASEEPVMIGKRDDTKVTLSNRYGLGDVAAVALRVPGRTLGIVIAGLTPDRGFGEAEQSVLGSITRELALVLAQVDATEERERNAAALTAERRLLRALVEAVPAGIVLVDRDERITMLSRLGAELLGLGDPDAWCGRPILDTVQGFAQRLNPASAAQLATALARDGSGSFDGFELRFDKPEDRVLMISARPVGSDGEQLGRVFVSLDVTAERAVAERMHRAQRMETLGTLASGVAHDFNNQLTAILGNARVLEASLAEEPSARAALADLEAAAEHCAELTRGLLDLARQTPAVMQPVEIERLLREVEALLRASIAPDVGLRIDVEPGARAHGDPAQLRRVFTNLALNARDAVGARGEIEIVVRAVHAERPPDGSPDALEFLVRDTGVGMDAHTLERVFDPFFTTKPATQGTGLGLAIVYRIVESHAASIEVASEPGRGTQFRIVWPAAVAAAQAPVVTGTEAVNGHELVLIAEDEPAVRRLSRAVLERRGYRVLEAYDGDEAVALFEQHRKAIDVLVIDLSMPRRSGLEVLAAVRETGKRVPAVLMSGHHDLEYGKDVPDGVVVLGKPFRPDELTSAVRRALDAADDET